MNTIIYPACDIDSYKATVNKMAAVLIKHWGYRAPEWHDFISDEHPVSQKAVRIAGDLYRALESRN